MEETTVRMSYEQLLLLHEYLNSVVGEEKIATIEGLCKLAYNQEETKSYVGAYAKARQANESYITYLGLKEGCETEDDLKDLCEQYEDAIKQAEKQKEDLAKLLEKEITVDIMKVGIDELLIDDYRAIRILLPWIEL